MFDDPLERLAQQLALLRSEVEELKLHQSPLRPGLAQLYGIFLGLPGLRALHFAGSADESGNLYDRSGQARTLTRNGGPLLNLYDDLVPYWALDGSGDYFARASETGLQITGAETYVDAARRGLTFITLARPTSLATDRSFGGKYSPTGNQRGWFLGTNSADASILQGVISSNGTATHTVAAASGTLVNDQWYFLAQRFIPSTSHGVYVNGAWTVNTTSVPASLFATSTADYRVGNRSSANTDVTADIMLAALLATALPDEAMDHLFLRSRPFLGI